MDATQLAVTTTPSLVLGADSTWVTERGSFNQPLNLTIHNLATASQVLLSGSSASTAGGYVLSTVNSVGAVLTLGAYPQTVFAITAAGATATIAVVVG